MQLREDEQARKERARELELKEKELEIRQRQLELEKQKVTLRETLPQGSTVELTCYYDERVEDKVRSLLQGMYRIHYKPI